MKDPRRLLDGDGTDEQRTLLRAGALEEPAPESRTRLLAALGMTAASTNSSAAQAQGSQSVTTGGLTAGGGAAAATKLAVLALGSAVVLGAGAMLWSRGESPAGRGQHTSADARTRTDQSAELPRDQQAAQNTTGSVALEIEAIERVRSELGRNDGRAALAALQRYASEHPRGVLAHEADVLRVEALLLDGEAREARDLAEQLLGRHGDSPHRARLQALARQAGAPATP